MKEAVSAEDRSRSSSDSHVTIPRVRRATLVARVLAITAAVFAFAAGVSVVPGLTFADQDALMVETWRAVGFFTFGALFALLAVRPLFSPALWLILLGNKLALAIMALSFGAEVQGAHQAVVWDGMLVVILLLGFTAASSARRARHSVMG